MPTAYENQSKRKLATTIVAIIVIAGIIMVSDYVKPKAKTIALSSSTPSTVSTQPTTTNSSTTTTATNSSQSVTASTTTPTPNTSGYKDGTYTSSSSYYVPRSSESIQVSVTIKDGVITNSTISNSEGDPTSARFQEDFAASYKSYVVGQKINSLQLSRISGASDTTVGFNNAINTIITQAKA